MESSDPRIASRSWDRPETNSRSLISRLDSSSSRSPSVTMTSLRLVISCPMIWSRLARVLVTEAVCASRLSSVPPSPWKTAMIS